MTPKEKANTTFNFKNKALFVYTTIKQYGKEKSLFLGQWNITPKTKIE